MNKSNLTHEWWDYTWNPIVGCSPVSEGCENCYAQRIANRFGWPWGQPVCHGERLDEPRKVKRPSRIFVCSMSDIGHPGLIQLNVTAIANAMLAAPWHTYIVLTKRPSLTWLRLLPPACWVGVSIESQEHIDRWPCLHNTAWPGALKFVSVEPMLGPVSFKIWDDADHDGIPDWVICGPETGPGARPCDPEWMDALAAESPCFFDKRATGWTRREFPEKVKA